MDSGEELLRDLLRDRNIPCSASWEYAIKQMESDPRFESVRSLPNRKSIFNEYKIKKAKDEKEEYRHKLKKAKDELDNFIQTDKRINSAIRYRQACTMFQEFDVWKAVPDDERRDIFDDAMNIVRERETTEAKILKKRNKEVLRHILDSMPSITAYTTWVEAHELLAENDAFAQDSDLLQMEKLDALDVFAEYIEQLEAEEKEERRRIKKRKDALERDNRIAFVKYLDELHAAGTLTSISKWMDLYPEISADPRYRALLGQPLSGSTALDLFKFYVEDLKARYEDEKQVIKDILRSRNYSVTLDSTFVDFATFVSEDERSAKLDGGNLKQIFERLLAKEKEKDRMRKRELMKERRKLEHGFLTTLAKHLDANIEDDANLDWDIVRPKICDEPSFMAIEKEEDRIEVFRRYIESLSNTCLHHHPKPKRIKRESKPNHINYSPSSQSNSPPILQHRLSTRINPDTIDLEELQRKRQQILDELASSRRAV